MMHPNSTPAAAALDPVIPNPVTAIGTATPAAAGFSYALIVEHMADGSTKERMLLLNPKSKGEL